MARLCPFSTKTKPKLHCPPTSPSTPVTIPLSLSPSPLPPPPSQGSAHSGKHRLRFGRGKRERGVFKTRFSGISPLGNGGPGGGGSRARMGSGSHRGERDGRCYTGKQCWDGEAGEAPAGVHLSGGKQPFQGPASRTTSGCPGRRGAGTPRSAPAQIPALNHKPNSVTPQDAPVPLRAKPQHSSQGHQIPPSHQILPGHLSLLCPRPRPLLVKAL